MKQKSDISKFKFFKGKGIKGFSVFVIAAFVFLMLTKLSDNYTEKLVFDVNLTGLKDEIILVADSNNTIEVLVKSKGFNLLWYAFYDPRPIVVDANKETFKRGRTLSWDAVNKLYVIKENLGAAFDIISIDPDTLVFTYDILASKKVPIIFNKQIGYASGYDVLDELKLSQDSVKLIGSQNALQAIEKIETNILELKEVKENINQTLKFNKFDNPNITIVPNEIDVSGIVKRFTEGNLSVAVELINVPLDVKLNYFPKEVSLSYYVDLENYNLVKETDFKIVCDYNDLKNEEQRLLSIEIIEKSNLVKATRLKQNSIEFIILE
jgi:hypothetical protein